MFGLALVLIRVWPANVVVLVFVLIAVKHVAYEMWSWVRHLSQDCVGPVRSAIDGGVGVKLFDGAIREAHYLVGQ